MWRFITLGIWLMTVLQSAKCQRRQQLSPSIIRDARLEPRVDGTFGFQYQTEDGISHTAQGDPSGYIQGSYSYKDPTGLKVNFNYFAGARGGTNSVPTYNNNNSPPEPQYNPPQTYNQPELYQPPEQYVPRTRPPASYSRSEYQPTYDRRYTEPSLQNEIYNNNRG